MNANLTTGTATGLGSDTLANFENLSGSSGNDTLTGSTTANTIDGGLGNDTMNGAGGVDTASFFGLAAVNTNLTTGVATGVGSDTLANFENLTGSSANDTLTGNAAVNTLNGFAGTDTSAGARRQRPGRRLRDRQQLDQSRGSIDKYRVHVRREPEALPRLDRLHADGRRPRVDADRPGGHASSGRRSPTPTSTRSRSRPPACTR